jgi:IclR family transcriptional regulator, acetate operon repressor
MKLGWSDHNDKSIVGRAFRLLTCFSAEDQELALVELVQRTGLPKATLHRLAGQLVEVGALQRAGKRYRLGLKLFELGSRVWTQRAVRDIAMPYMQELYAMTEECVHLGWLDDGDVLLMDRIRGHGSSRMPTRPGERRPTYCTGLGKAMLAFARRESLEHILARGLKPLSPHTITRPQQLVSQLLDIQQTMVAYDREESRMGVGCVAAPILDACGNGIGAISVAAPASRIKGLRIDGAVRDAGVQITRGLGLEYESALTVPRSA